MVSCGIDANINSNEKIFLSWTTWNADANDVNQASTYIEQFFGIFFQTLTDDHVFVLGNMFLFSQEQYVSMTMYPTTLQIKTNNLMMNSLLGKFVTLEF